MKAKNPKEFDELITTKLFGFKNADEYYKLNIFIQHFFIKVFFLLI